LINEVKQRYNTSSIIITHGFTYAKTIAHRVMMLLDGRFFKIGTFEDIFDTYDPQIKCFYSYNFRK